MRSDDEALHGLLRRILAAHLVDGVDAPPAYSVRWHPHGVADDGALYRFGCPVLRASSPRRLMRGLLAHLSAEVVAGGRLLRVRAAALVSTRGALLCPTILRPRLVAADALLRRTGFRLLEAPEVAVTVPGGQVAARPPVLDVDQAALDALDELDGGTEDGQPAIGEQPVPILGWGLHRPGREPGTALTPAEAVFHAVGLMRAPPAVTAQEALETLAMVFERATPLPLTGSSTADYRTLRRFVGGEVDPVGAC